MKFFEIDDYMNDLRGKNIIIGGRGIGKTYSSLRNALNSLLPGRKFRSNSFRPVLFINECQHKPSDVFFRFRIGQHLKSLHVFVSFC